MDNFSMNTALRNTPSRLQNKTSLFSVHLTKPELTYRLTQLQVNVLPSTRTPKNWKIHIIWRWLPKAVSSPPTANGDNIQGLVRVYKCFLHPPGTQSNEVLTTAMHVQRVIATDIEGKRIYASKSAWWSHTPLRQRCATICNVCSQSSVKRILARFARLRQLRIYHSGDRVIIIDEASESGNYQLARFRFNEVQFTLSESPPKKSVNYDEHLHPFD